MAAVTAAAVSLSSPAAAAKAKAASPSSPCSQVQFLSLYPQRRRHGARAVRVQVSSTETAEAEAVKKEKVSKKQDEGVVTNKYRPKEPYIGRCLSNTRITGDDAPGETWHMVFSTEGEVPYREGQSIGIIADGEDKNGKPHKLRLYSIASSALGDFGDSKTVSLCVKRLVYTNDQGEIVKGARKFHKCAKGSTLSSHSQQQQSASCRANPNLDTTRWLAMDSTRRNQVAGRRSSSTIASRAAATAPPLLTMPGGELADAIMGGVGGGGGGATDGDPRAALLRLAALGDRMAAVRGRISASMSGEARPLSYADIQSVSSEISSAAQLVVLNAAELLACSVPFPAPPPPSAAPSPAPAPVREIPAVAAASAQEQQPLEAARGDDGGGYEIVELDAAELLAEHVHFCEICGKGFRRDANLRMHMRAHGDRFKTLDALSRPGHGHGGQPPKPPAGSNVRFSCPFAGCNRNRAHRRFRPLKSAVCARNHFRRSHCPKLYACERCGGKKRFAVLADLRSHLRHCGEEAQWRCSCGTTFSRKDKLFGHLALFEGHTPAITKPNKDVVTGPTESTIDAMEEVGFEEGNPDREEDEEGGYDPEFFKEWMEELGGGAGGSNWPGPAAAGQ